MYACLHCLIYCEVKANTYDSGAVFLHLVSLAVLLDYNNIASVSVRGHSCVVPYNFVPTPTSVLPKFYSKCASNLKFDH